LRGRRACASTADERSFLNRDLLKSEGTAPAKDYRLTSDSGNLPPTVTIDPSRDEHILQLVDQDHRRIAKRRDGSAAPFCRSRSH
jgi:hypothetical protein